CSATSWTCTALWEEREDEEGDDMKGSDLQHELGRHLREELLAGRLSRREFLRRATVLGLSAGTIAGLLAGAGGGSARAQTPPPKPGGTPRVALVPPTPAAHP